MVLTEFWTFDSSTMGTRILYFFLLYVLIPLVIIPLLCLKYQNMFGLFASALYYIGIIIARTEFSIVLPVPIIFSAWYWYSYGFSPFDYVFVFLLSLIAGYLMYRLKVYLDTYLHNILPEEDINEAYNQKLRLLEKRVEEYRRQHPGEKVTQELIDRFKTEIFF